MTLAVPAFRGTLRPALMLAVVAPVAIAACGRGTRSETHPPPANVIAEIAGAPVTREQFEMYVAEVLPSGPEEPSDAPPAELMSRLLDRFLNEELIMREAVGRGVEVTEREVTDALRKLQGSEPARAAVSRVEQTGSRERMKRALLARKFREDVVLKGLKVDDEEVAAHYEAHRDEFHQPAHIVLRQILLEDPEEAKKVRDVLAADPTKFQETAEARSLAPDGGRPRAYAEADLPPEVLAATASVPPGGVSDVVVSEGMGRIFMVEQRQPDRLVGIDEASDRIRVGLLQEKGRRAFEAFMLKLREGAGLVIHEENLSFPYKRRSA